MVSQTHGGLFHAAIADSSASGLRERVLREMFAEIDYNNNGYLDTAEVSDYLEWAASNSEADEMHKRLAVCFLEGQSLEAAFKRYVRRYAAEMRVN